MEVRSSTGNFLPSVRFPSARSPLSPATIQRRTSCPTSGTSGGRYPNHPKTRRTNDSQRDDRLRRGLTVRRWGETLDATLDLRPCSRCCCHFARKLSSLWPTHRGNPFRSRYGLRSNALNSLGGGIWRTLPFGDLFVRWVAGQTLKLSRLRLGATEATVARGGSHFAGSWEVRKAAKAGRDTGRFIVFLMRGKK